MAQVSTHRSPRTLALAVAALLAAMPAAAQDATLAQQAREAAWAGRLGEGLRLMDAHLAAHPQDRAARLDRARFLAWRGDYAGAIAALDALGPDTPEAQALRARVYAWAGFRDTALALNAPAYSADPSAREAAFTQALAARHGAWPHEAMTPLAAVEAASPDTRDTRDLARAVRLPLFSSVGPVLSRYEDSDDIEIRSAGLQAAVRVSDTWTLLGEAADRRHSAPANGPFSPFTGGDHVDERRLLVGARYAASPDTELEVLLGQSHLDPGDAELVGHALLTRRAGDALRFGVGAHRERVAASPRSLSLDILREGGRAFVDWRPGLADTVRGSLIAERLTDGNRRVALDADYRHAVFRSERVNVDLGLQGEWQSYSRGVGFGYYSPERYVRLAPVASAYVKFNDDAGLFLQAATGVQRDETFDGWERASDISAELTLGIFSQWELAARAGYSERLNQFGQYEGANVGVVLRYRFCSHRPGRCPQPR